MTDAVGASTPAGSSTRPTSGSPSATARRSTTPEDLAGTVVAFRNGAPLRLGRRGRRQIGFPPPIGDAVINDGPGLLLIVEKQPTGNTLEVTRNVEKALDDLRAGPEGRRDRPDHLPPGHVHRAVARQPLARDARRLRPGRRHPGRVPVRLADGPHQPDGDPAVAGRRDAGARPACGATINTMVLAGLVIALGEVVDDAIIDVENIVRRLRLNRAAGSPRSAFQVVLDASLEVRSAVVYASLIVILVFLPVFFLDGLAGSFFRPLALAYVLAILASLLVALTVTPALSLMLLTGRDRRGTRAAAGARAQGALSRDPAARSSRGRGWAVARPGRRLRADRRSRSRGWAQEFLPDFQETDFLMHWVEKPGTSLEAMRRITVRASKELRGDPRRAQLRLAHRPGRGRRRGRRAELHRALDQRRPEGRLRRDREARSQKVVDGYPGLYRDVLTYLQGADQGSAHRRRGDDRGADLRPRPRRAARRRRRRSRRRWTRSPG